LPHVAVAAFVARVWDPRQLAELIGMFLFDEQVVYAKKHFPQSSLHVPRSVTLGGQQLPNLTSSPRTRGLNIDGDNQNTVLVQGPGV
jgi:hypothetical protein